MYRVRLALLLNPAQCDQSATILAAGNKHNVVPTAEAQLLAEWKQRQQKLQ